MVLRTKSVFGVEKGRKRPSVELDHKPNNCKKRKPSTALSDDNLENNYSAGSPDEFIPIPGVTEVPSYANEHGQETNFYRPKEYIKQVMDELSYALTRRSANYDMDDDDEEWLQKFNTVANKGFGSSFASLSYETFELIIDAFEKAFFRCPDEFNNLNNPQVLVGCLCSEDVAAAVYRYWLKKRKGRKSALVRVFEAHRVKKRRGRKKNWNRLEREGISDSRAMKPVASEDAVVVEEEYADMKLKLSAAEEAAKKLGDLAVKKRNEAQLIMKKADVLMFRATMALRIAEGARIRESLASKFSN